nr:hypothetical protein [Trichocoleus desertorum]
MTQQELDRLIQQKPDLTLAEIRDLRKQVKEVRENDRQANPS